MGQIVAETKGMRLTWQRLQCKKKFQCRAERRVASLLMQHRLGVIVLVGVDRNPPIDVVYDD